MQTGHTQASRCFLLSQPTMTTLNHVYFMYSMVHKPVPTIQLPEKQPSVPAPQPNNLAVLGSLLKVADVWHSLDSGFPKGCLKDEPEMLGFHLATLPPEDDLIEEPSHSKLNPQNLQPPIPPPGIQEVQRSPLIHRNVSQDFIGKCQTLCIQCFFLYLKYLG